MCAESTVQEEQEEDPSDGKSDYALDEYALLSDLSTGKSYTSSFSPTTNTTSGAYNQYNQDELLSDFNIIYNKGDSPPSLSPINTNTDSVTPSNQFKLITPMQKYTRSKSAAGNSSPLLSFDNTIIDRSKSAAGNSSTLLSLTSSAFNHTIIDMMEREGEGNDTKMAETKNLGTVGGITRERWWHQT